MRKAFFILILISLAVFPVFSFANGSHSLSLEDVLNEIMSSQNVDKAVSINCQEVLDGQFEELGEAVMSLIHPNEQQHEFMDQMMGGEGSESLMTMHIVMGKNYLGCGSGGEGGMMGGGIMGGMDMMSMMGNWSDYSNNNLFNNMMGSWGGLGIITMVLFWVLVIIGIIFFIKWLISQSKGGGSSKSAIDILKERYAKGEISKAEFEEIKKELGNKP